MSSNELTQKMVLEHFPFTVVKAEPKLCYQDTVIEGKLNIQLKNPFGVSLVIGSEYDWQILTPTNIYTPDYWGDFADSHSSSDYDLDLQTVCQELVGAQLTDICGYENLHANTFVFDNNFVLRLMNSSDSWGGYEGGFVELDDSDHRPWTGYLWAKEMREKYLPLDITTSLRNPFDVLLDVSHPVLQSAVGAVVVDVECPAQKKPDCRAYALRIYLDDGSVIFVRNSWSVSSSRGVWVAQTDRYEAFEQDFVGMFWELVGQRFLGFAGPADLVQPSLLFDGGTRVDQMAEQEVIGVVRPRGWWSVSNRYGVFKR